MTEIRAADRDAIDQAAGLLRRGELVAIPTETVYGLAANATDDRAVARIFEAKGRPRFNPLIVHVGSPAEAARFAVMDDRVQELAQRFWPGPLTLVVPVRPPPPSGAAEPSPPSTLSPLATAGLDTVAVRLPAHPVARAVIAAAGVPLAAPSANRSGAVSPTDPRAVHEELAERVALILAAGRSPIGVESTVLDLCGDRPHLLRPGGCPLEEIVEAIGPVETAAVRADDDAMRPRSPGLAGRHYAPRTPLRLEARHHKAGEALVTFGPDLRQGPEVANLSADGDLVEAAANLFHLLRRLDKGGYAAIAVSPIPMAGLGLAINDRLRRAALPDRIG